MLLYFDIILIMLSEEDKNTRVIFLNKLSTCYHVSSERSDLNQFEAITKKKIDG